MLLPSSKPAAYDGTPTAAIANAAPNICSDTYNQASKNHDLILSVWLTYTGTEKSKIGVNENAGPRASFEGINYLS